MPINPAKMMKSRKQIREGLRQAVFGDIVYGVGKPKLYRVTSKDTGKVFRKSVTLEQAIASTGKSLRKYRLEELR